VTSDPLLSTINSQYQLSEAPQQARWITYVDPGNGNIFRHDRAGSDDYAIANCNGKKGGVGSDADVVTDFCRSPKIGISSGGTSVSKEVVDKHRAVGDEAVVPRRHQLTNKRMRLDPAAPADVCPFLDFDEWSDERFIPDRAAIKIHRLYHGDVFAKLDINDSRRSKVRCVHEIGDQRGGYLRYTL
jgi:hypothetical protein